MRRWPRSRGSTWATTISFQKNSSRSWDSGERRARFFSRRTATCWARNSGAGCRRGTPPARSWTSSPTDRSGVCARGTEYHQGPPRGKNAGSWGPRFQRRPEARDGGFAPEHGHHLEDGRARLLPRERQPGRLGQVDELHIKLKGELAVDPFDRRFIPGIERFQTSHEPLEARADLERQKLRLSGRIVLARWLEEKARQLDQLGERPSPLTETSDDCLEPRLVGRARHAPSIEEREGLRGDLGERQLAQPVAGEPLELVVIEDRARDPDLLQ